MNKVLYVTDFISQEWMLEDAICFDDLGSGIILSTQDAFNSFITNICEQFNIQETIFRLYEKVILSAHHSGKLLISTTEIIYMIIDYLYSKYADTNLANCRIINLIYMYDVSIFVFDESCLDLIGSKIGILTGVLDVEKNLRFIKEISENTTIPLEALDYNDELYMFSFLAGINENRWKLLYKKEINDSGRKEKGTNQS